MKNTTMDYAAMTWRKSTYSNGGDSNCVEVADGFLGVVPVRDSKIQDGPVVVVSSAAWTSFVRGLKV
ncbi:DUF397 domain-containing protein [Streptomyces phytohabitans]|uniref:DUF397 domain-containing protein n=1 Tax=Streptomyces phytohabitans TaxID=1150371 RepID=UPI00345BE289